MSNIIIQNLNVSNQSNVFTDITCSTLNVSGDTKLSNLNVTNLTVGSFSLTSLFTASNMSFTGVTNSNLVVTNNTMTNLVVTTPFIKSTNTSLYLVPNTMYFSVSGQTSPCTIAYLSVSNFDTMYNVDLVIDVTSFTSGTQQPSVTFTPPGQLTANTNYGMFGVNQTNNSMSTTFGGTATNRQWIAFTTTYLCKANTPFIISTTGGTFSMTYQAQCVIQQLTFA